MKDSKKARLPIGSALKIHVLIGSLRSSLAGGIFLGCGVLFAWLFAGSRFKPQIGESVTKSFVFTFYKDRPGRFVITSRRLVFVPEAISQWFGATRVSIESDLVSKVESSSTAAGGTLKIATADGSLLQFKMPNMILVPLLAELKKAGIAN